MRVWCPRRLQEASNPVSYRNLEYCDVGIGFALNVLYDIGLALCSCLRLLIWMVTERLAWLVRESLLLWGGQMLGEMV